MMKKAKLNIIIDFLMFGLLMAISGIGLLLKYRLVRGSLRREIFGTNIDQFLWGWERHQWGSLHLILSFILLGLLVLHIVFHWKQIKAMVRRLIPAKILRVILVFGFLALSALVLFFAFIVKIDTVQIKEGEGEHWGQRRGETWWNGENTLHAPTDEKKAGYGRTETARDHQFKDDNEGEHELPHDLRSNDIVVNGTMTLAEISSFYKVPVESLKVSLKIPGNVSNRERLGRLRRHYGFHMSEIERIIELYQKRH